MLVIHQIMKIPRVSGTYYYFNLLLLSLRWLSCLFQCNRSNVTSWIEYLIQQYCGRQYCQYLQFKIQRKSLQDSSGLIWHLWRTQRIEANRRLLDPPQRNSWNLWWSQKRFFGTEWNFERLQHGSVSTKVINISRIKVAKHLLIPKVISLVSTQITAINFLNKYSHTILSLIVAAHQETFFYLVSEIGP